MILKEIFKKYPTQESLINDLEKVIWHGEPQCPYCNATYSTKIPNNRYKCNKCNQSFSVTVGTVFHKTKIDLRKWIIVIDLVGSGNYLPVRELGAIVGVTKDTAWRMLKQAELLKRNNRELFIKIHKLGTI